MELFPEIEFNASDNRNYALSFRIDAGYRYGLGNDSVEPSRLNSIYIAGPVMLNFFLSGVHRFRFGLGPLYELDLLTIDRKYVGTSTERSNLFGFRFTAGYRYTANRNWPFSTGLNFDTWITENTSPVMQPYLEVSRVICSRARTVRR
jgi:hypothetical protein